MKKVAILPDAATGAEKLATDENRFGDKADVAALVGVSRRTVDSLIAQGCPHLKIGARRVRFDLPEVKSWLKERFGTQRKAAR